MPRTTGSSCTSKAAGVPRSTNSNSSKTRSRSTAQKRKLPDGWPPPRRPPTCRETRSTSGPSTPRRGCPNTAPRTGYARSTATNPGTTNCAPKPSITAALPCTPTLRTIQGCSSDQRVVSYSPAMPAVRDHMSSDLLSVETSVSIMEVAQRMVDRNVGAVLVLDDGRLAGILTERDVLRAVARGLRDTTRVG